MAVAIVAPGVSSSFRNTLARSGADDSLSVEGTSAEREAMEIIGAHRAIARGGAYVALPTLPVELFRQLSRLEKEYSSEHRNPRRVLDLLSKLGRRANEFLEGQLYRGLFAKSSDVLIISQFPLGLATLPGSRSPLSAMKPVYYRPLIPLTRALQIELNEHASYYWETKRPRLLIVECLEPTDRLYRDSMSAWTAIRSEMAYAYEVEIATASSIKEVDQHIQRCAPQMMILSGHGTPGPAMNQRSVRIGNEYYSGIEIGALPPVVFLSACETAPRGSGDLNVADTMLRHGAYAVICCMVPVDPVHNGRFFTRVLQLVTAAREGRAPLRNLAEVWHHTVMTHPVFDILHSLWRERSSEPLDLDAFRMGFFAEESTPIRRTHSYQDAMTRLEAIADRFGQKKLFKTIISRNGFMPESLFYMVLGWPEKIVLQSVEHRQFLERAEVANAQLP